MSGLRIKHLVGLLTWKFMETGPTHGNLGGLGSIFQSIPVRIDIGCTTSKDGA